VDDLEHVAEPFILCVHVMQQFKVAVHDKIYKIRYRMPFLASNL